MKLRRRFIKYFIFLVIISSVCNIGMNYYLTHTAIEYSYTTFRKQFLQKTIDNLQLYYEEHGSWREISEERVRPKGIGLQLPNRFAWLTNDSNASIDLPVSVNSGWDILVTDENGIFVIGKDNEGLRSGTVYCLESQGNFIGSLWIIPKSDNLWEYCRQQLLLPLLFRNFITSLIFSILSLGIAFILSNYTVQHINELAIAARKIARGELDHRVKAGAKDELGELATDFNAMADRLQEDQKLRRQLQTDVVHELRTPLAVCQAILDSLDSGVIQYDGKTLASLQEETSRMNRLVTDLHELNRADNHQLPLYKELFLVGDLVERVQESFGEFARQKNIDFFIKTDRIAANELLYADPDRTMQIITNLLHNALRHTPAGGLISVHIHKTPADRMIAISVKDTGEGIAEEHLPRIFDRFFCEGQSRSRQNSGTGLGLAIAKEYALLHGGDIKVKSSLGQGTEFIIILPSEGSEQPPVNS